jgi:hypothetical protein
MASLNEAQETPDPRRDSEELGRDIARMQTELERLVQVAGLKTDPTLPLVKVLSSSLRLQWRLHNQAVRHFHDASDRLDRQYQETIKKTELSIKQGEQALEAKQNNIVDQLAPRLVASVSDTVRKQVKFLKYRTIGLCAGTLLLATAFCGAITYVAGINQGQYQGEQASETIHEATATSSAAAILWASLMDDNDAVSDIAACRKNISIGDDGRRYCSMPVWLDPPQTKHP